MKMATFRQSTSRQSTHSCNRASYHESAGCITCDTQSTWLGTFILGKKGNPALLGQHRLSDAQYIANSRKGVVFQHSECLAGIFVTLTIYVRTEHREILRRFSELAGSSDQDSEFSATIRGISFPTS